MAAKAIASFTSTGVGLGLSQKLQDRALWKIWAMAAGILIGQLRLSRKSADQDVEEEKQLITGIDNLLRSLGLAIFECAIARACFFLRGFLGVLTFTALLEARFEKMQASYAAALAGQ